MCVYRYIHRDREVIIWAKFVHLGCYFLGEVDVLIWAKFVLSLFCCGFTLFFLHTQLPLCGLWEQLSGNFLRIASFFCSKIGRNKFVFPVLSLTFEQSFLCLLNTIKIGVSALFCFVFLMFKEKKRAKKR